MGLHYKCSKCAKEKKISDFSVDKSRTRGHKSQCKACVTAHRVVTPELREKRRVHSALNKERLAANAREWYRNNKERAAATVQAYREANPEKYAAHELITQAIRRGDIMQAPCEVCGDVKSQAHHDDYTKPLEVRWLCITHHKAHHAEVNHGAS